MELTTPVPLTSLSHGAGCACKIGPGELEAIVQGLPRREDAALLVGFETCDDAGVYLISEELALVQTVDFFTPIVDDPYDFGRIAATNALSDLYAMGARPITALNLVACSLEDVGADVLQQILRGGADVAATAGATIVGGHSIDDPEPKYGMAVTGVAHPDRVIRNSTAGPGDVLFLTKPVGGGIVTTAVKRGHAPSAVLERCVEVMTTLNQHAAEAALSIGPSAITDVTGFGLLGHLRELAAASRVEARVEAVAVPAIEGVMELLAGGNALSGGSRRNRAFLEQHVHFDPGISENLRALLCDAMTSGGLLVAAPAGVADAMERALGSVAPDTRRIGVLADGETGRISVV
jgi:selenide, water dikinase